MDLAHGGLWPSEEGSVFTHGGWPSGEERPRLEGIISSQGWSGYGPRSWGIFALWEDSVLAHGGWPSGAV